jgi:hypothetical protein
MAKGDIRKIEGIDVLQIGVDATAQTISKGDNAGQTYYRARFEGKGFIINEAFLNAFNAGEIAQLILQESDYQIEDPLDPTQMITRPSWQVVSSATYQQVTMIETQQGKLALGRKKLDVELQVLEKEALQKLELSAEKLAKLQEAL